MGEAGASDLPSEPDIGLVDQNRDFHAWPGSTSVRTSARPSVEAADLIGETDIPPTDAGLAAEPVR
jgi:hypothetical protein